MAEMCHSKLRKLGSLKDQVENPYANCKFKIEYPPIRDSKTTLGRGIADRNLKQNNNNVSKGVLGFQCHYEERMKRADFRRKKIVQKLKKNYDIDVEGLNEHVTREIILKTTEIEKQKKQKEKRNIERMVTIITRLIQEQKYKSRGSKVYPPPWRKTARKLAVSKFVEKNIRKESETASEITSKCAVLAEKVKFQAGIKSDQNLEKKPSEVKSGESFKSAKEEVSEAVSEEEISELPKCVDKNKAQDPTMISRFKNIIRKPRSPCLSVEYCLDSVPKNVVFKDYKKNKVYLQELRIINIGKETIHCRYLGIVVHDYNEEKFPIGVAVRDNVKLRPGLCCSTKIRLCSQDDTKKLQCTIVYETRREKSFLQHSWFFVPVICTPIQAIVRVFPLKINFPSLTWCEATDPESKKLLTKILKIENSGAKACSCKIITKKCDTKLCQPEYRGEAEGEIEFTVAKSYKAEVSDSSQKLITYEGEFDGEGYEPFHNEGEKIAQKLMDEILEFVWGAFHFSKIHYIEIPPVSTTQVQVRFSPQYKGFHHEVYYILFEDCDNVKEKIIELTGNIKPIPIRAEPQLIDLKTCIASSGVYAGIFRVYNDSKGPYSVFLKIPPVLKKHAHVYPRASTIQPLSFSDFSVRIYPRSTLLKDASPYYNENSQVLEFPIFIHPGNKGACKKDYIKIYVFALITDYCLELSPSFISFGVVTTLETVRTEVVLTNHSLILQEYGFLNLPKGVRVEPNMGFGEILPKESITLDLLYSPVEELFGSDEDEGEHEFQVEVTSIAKHGGFKEKLEPDEESASKTVELFWGEFSVGNESSYSENPPPCMPPEDSDNDICEEESSIEGEELCSKLFQEENKIREFLHQDGRKISEHSYIKRMTTQPPELSSFKTSLNDTQVQDEEDFKDFSKYRETCGVKSTITCRAIVLIPRCRLSETVILLPATSCSSFSLFRFRLKCLKRQANINCSCGYRKVSKCQEKEKTQSSFEFLYDCPHIKFEPQTGFIRPGESLPIKIIYRPEFPAEQLHSESKSSKAQKIQTDTAAEKELQAGLNSKPPKGKPNSPKTKAQETVKKPSLDVINAALLELDNNDLFLGEKNLSKSINPFSVQTKVRCVIKQKSCDEQNEKTEVHEMIVICPAIKPNFIYLGNSQEIKFNKVFIGTKSRIVLQVQNISCERTSFSATLLNPVGPFYCPAGIRKLEVDPEHIWRQPLTYAPLEQKGIEKQFFEIYCGPTNILLSVSGEGVLPEYKITPNIACCRLEAKPGQSEEIKLEMENLSTIPLNIYIETEFVKEGPEIEELKKLEEEPKEKSEKADSKEDKKKSKNSGKNENCQVWEDVPQTILSGLEKFQEVSPENWKMFTLMGVGNDNELQILPYTKMQIKIQFKPPDSRSEISYAVKYIFKLEKVSPLKDILVLGKVFRGNEKTKLKA